MDAFGFEQAALEGAVGLGDEKASAGAHDAMPGDTLSAGASGHGVANGARAAGKAESTSEFSVGGHFAPRNLLDEAVDGLPGHCVCILRDEEKNLPQRRQWRREDSQIRDVRIAAMLQGLKPLKQKRPPSVPVCGAVTRCSGRNAVTGERTRGAV